MAHEFGSLPSPGGGPAQRQAVPAAALDAAELARWDRDGMLPLRGLVPAAAELVALRGLVDALFAARARGERGPWFDRLDPDDGADGDGAEAPLLHWPSRQAPWLASTLMRRNAHALARRLLGPEAELVWEAAVLLPPRGTAPVISWRQDEAGFTPGTPYREAVSVWIPLQEVAEGTGCPRFLRGSHRGPLLPHGGEGAAAGAGPGLAPLPREAAAVAVPLRAGDAVVHHSRTLHALCVNAGDQPRRAMALDFAVRAHRPAEPGPRGMEKGVGAGVPGRAPHRPPLGAPGLPDEALASRVGRRVRTALRRLGW